MKIIKYSDLTEDMIEKFTDIQAEAFQHNEFLYMHLMGGNPRLLRKFMKMNIVFNNHFADYYALIKDDGEWGAVVTYLPAGYEPIGLKSVLRRKQLLVVLRFLVAQPMKYTRRMMKFFNLEEKNWYKEPCVTLDVLASLGNGCGKALVDATISNYNGQNIMLNSSVSQNDHSYYRQFGFEPYAELLLDNYKTVMMVKKA